MHLIAAFEFDFSTQWNCSGMLYVGADKAYLIDRKFCCRSVDHGVYALALGTAPAHVWLDEKWRNNARCWQNDSQPHFLSRPFSNAAFARGRQQATSAAHCSTAR
jgi:hypothetical protein